MASIHQVGKRGLFSIHFRVGRKQYQRALSTANYKEALAQCARVEETISLIERGRLEIPESVELCEFILSDGRLKKPVDVDVYWLPVKRSVVDLAIESRLKLVESMAFVRLDF